MLATVNVILFLLPDLCDKILYIRAFHLFSWLSAYLHQICRGFLHRKSFWKFTRCFPPPCHPMDSHRCCVSVWVPFKSVLFREFLSNQKGWYSGFNSPLYEHLLTLTPGISTTVTVRPHHHHRYTDHRRAFAQYCDCGPRSLMAVYIIFSSLFLTLTETGSSGACGENARPPGFLLSFPHLSHTHTQPGTLTVYNTATVVWSEQVWSDLVEAEPSFRALRSLGGAGCSRGIFFCLSHI